MPKSIRVESLAPVPGSAEFVRLEEEVSVFLSKSVFDIREHKSDERKALSEIRADSIETF